MIHAAFVFLLLLISPVFHIVDAGRERATTTSGGIHIPVKAARSDDKSGNIKVNGQHQKPVGMVCFFICCRDELRNDDANISEP